MTENGEYKDIQKGEQKMAKTLKTIQTPKEEKSMTISGSDLSSSGVAYKLAFRTGVHTDKKKQNKKNACRKFNKKNYI